MAQAIPNISLGDWSSVELAINTIRDILNPDSNILFNNANFSGTLDVTGATTLAGTLDVTGAATLGSTLEVTGNTTLSADVSVGGDLDITGTLELTGFTEGSVLFINADSEIAEDNANFFWDDSNNRLGLGTNSPSDTLHVAGTIKVDDYIDFQTSYFNTFLGYQVGFG